MMQYLTLENVQAVFFIVVTTLTTLTILIDNFTDIRPSDSADAFASRVRKVVARIEKYGAKLSLYKPKE